MLELVNSNALHIPLKDKSVHCVVTSPPYYGLRDYGTAQWEGGNPECTHEVGRFLYPVSDKQRSNNGSAGHQARDICPKCGAQRIDKQLGMEQTPEQYVEHMVTVFREIWRVLRDDGVVFLNLGDSYFGSGGAHKLEHANPGLSRSAFRGGVPHVKPYGTSDKAPVSSQEHDCLCENLCDVCRRAYLIGRFHNGNSHVPMLSVLPCETNRDCKVSVHDHLPTSDLENQPNRNENATQDFGSSQDLVDEQPPASQESMLDLSSQQHQVNCHQSDKPLVCLLCGKPLIHDVQECVHKSGDSLVQSSHNQSNALPADQQMHHSQCKGMACEYYSENGSYPYSTIEYHLKPKDLLGIPWRVAFALQADGWYLRCDVIWHKINPMPEPVLDRPTKSHEYLFLLTKSQKYFYDADAVREPSTELPSGNKKAKDNHQSGRSHFLTSVPYQPKGNGRNKRSVWTFPTKPYSGAVETDHLKRVQVGEVSDGTICIPLPNCPIHAGLAAQVAKEFCDEPSDDLMSRIQNIYARLFLKPFSDYVPTDQQRALGFVEQSSGYSPLSYSPAAIDHNNESHRMALSLDSTAPYIPFYEKFCYIADKQELLSSFVQHLCIYGNSILKDDFDARLLVRIPHHIVDKSFSSPVPPECRCLYYNNYTVKSDHFATFPPALVEPCIKAGTSEKGRCPVCGKAWERIIEKGESMWEERKANGAPMRKGMSEEGILETHNLSGSKHANWKAEHPDTFVGWRPGCSHDAEPVPCIVFDPFAGSGTTLLVARQLGRSSIGIDLSYTYLHEQARKRLSLDKLRKWIG